MFFRNANKNQEKIMHHSRATKENIISDLHKQLLEIDERITVQEKFINFREKFGDCHSHDSLVTLNAEKRLIEEAIAAELAASESSKPMGFHK